ncbi:MAG: hypothetical protein L0H70_05005 [Xanthomonadales bacterium]|nr:hypothetical protein [Xanthomonadales bacterium]
MKPATQFLLSGILAIIVVTVLMGGCIAWLNKRTATAHQLTHLQAVAQAESALQSGRLETLQLRALSLAADPGFVGYVAHALIPDPALGGGIHAASIGDLLQQKQHGKVILMVLDRQGYPVSRVGRMEKQANAIKQNPLITRCIASGDATGGIWADGGRLLWVAVQPMLRGGTLKGLVVMATPIDDAFAIAVSRISGADVAMLSHASTASISARSNGVDGWEMQALAAHVPDMHAAGLLPVGRAVTLAAAGQSTVAWVTPLPLADGHASMVALDHHAGDHPLVNADSWPFLGGIAVLGLLAMMWILVEWKRTWIPLQNMHDVVERAAAGDHFMHINVGGSAIVGYLRAPVNQLLDQLTK